LFENDQEIRNRHKYFHQAEKNSRFGYWEFDLTNNIVKTSEGMEKIVSTNKSLYRLGGDEFAFICKEYSDNKNC